MESGVAPKARLQTASLHRPLLGFSANHCGASSGIFFSSCLHLVKLIQPEIPQ